MRGQATRRGGEGGRGGGIQTSSKIDEKDRKVVRSRTLASPLFVTFFFFLFGAAVFTRADGVSELADQGMPNLL